MAENEYEGYMRKPIHLVLDARTYYRSGAQSIDILAKIVRENTKSIDIEDLVTDSYIFKEKVRKGLSKARINKKYIIGVFE